MRRALRWAGTGIVIGVILLVPFAPGGVRSAVLPRASAAVFPAGDTGAVLSLIDAASNTVEVVRHWPAAPVDATLSPYVPRSWDGCPGAGAIVMLITGPGPALAADAAAALEERAPHAGPMSGALARVIATLRTPGSIEAETLKTAAPLVSGMAAYERDGYAVFLFVHWTGAWCSVTVQAVPEGYGIPFVR